MPNDFAQAVDRLNTYDPDMFLGRVAYYAITEESYVDHSTFCQALLSVGLNALLPPVPRQRDIFKRACTAAQRKRVPTSQPGVFVNFMLREVGKDADNVWRRVVAETVDANGRTLTYIEMFDVHFYQPDGSIKITPWPDGEPADLPDAAIITEATIITETIRTLYVGWQNTLTPFAVRELIRKIIRGLSATVMRDGLYFVREAHAAKIEALETVVNATPGGSIFHSFPVIDDSKQREALRKAFEAESVEQVDRLLGDIREIMIDSDKRITSDRFAGLKMEYDGLRRKCAEYSDLLDTALVETASRLEIMDAALFELMGRVRV